MEPAFCDNRFKTYPMISSKTEGKDKVRLCRFQ